MCVYVGMLKACMPPPLCSCERAPRPCACFFSHFLLCRLLELCGLSLRLCRAVRRATETFGCSMPRVWAHRTGNLCLLPAHSLLPFFTVCSFSLLCLLGERHRRTGTNAVSHLLGKQGYEHSLSSAFIVIHPRDLSRSREKYYDDHIKAL